MKGFFSKVCFVMIIFTVGCSKPVLRQDIPVTTNPLGAKILVNGQPAGATPTTVSLERTRDHILTLIKDNYRQEDVVITKQYQKEKTYLKAIHSGVNSGLFFKDARMGMMSGMSTLSSQEETGEAYILVPPAVKLTLTPVSAPLGKTAAPLGKTTTLNAVSETSVQSSETAASPSMEDKEIARELLKIGAGASLSQARPFEKKIDGSSSSRTYKQPDGTVVTEKSSSSVSASINPTGLVDNIIDVLFK